MLAIIIVLQIAAGILGFVYRDNAQDFFEEDYAKRLTSAIEVYRDDKSAKKAIDTLQKEVIIIFMYNYLYSTCIT